MDNNITTTRVNIRVSHYVKQWFQEKSDETGISMSALMAMALNEYIDQKDSLKAMTRVEYFTNQLQEIKEKVDNELTLSEKLKNIQNDGNGGLGLVAAMFENDDIN